MSIRLAPIALLFLTAKATLAATDPCASWKTNAAAYQNCVAAIPGCSSTSLSNSVPLGAVDQSCLTRVAGIPPAPGNQAVGGGQAAPPPPNANNSKNVNRAENWDAQKFNNSLFQSEAGQGTQAGDIKVTIDAGGNVHSTNGGGTFVDQKDAFNAHNSLLVSCAVTHVSGRTDQVCLDNPHDPECTGMNSALGNAVVCTQQGPWDPVAKRFTCLAYGAFGYTLDEWLVFGQQYYNGMQGCFQVSNGADTTGWNGSGNRVVDRKGRLENLTDFAAFPPGSTGPGRSVSGASTITGQPSKENLETDVRLNAVADKVDDGAAYLGLEKGELLRRAAKGQTFLSAFTDSPFAQNLAKTTRELVETALASPGDTLDRVKERKLAQEGAEKEEAVAKAGSPASAGPDSTAPGLGSGRLSKNETMPTLLEGSAASTPARSPASAPVAGFAKAPERNRELADARALLGGSPSPPATGGAPSKAAAPASPQNAPELGSAEASLFERISLSYRRRAAQFRGFNESRTARDVRLTERPQFFEEL